MIASDPLRVIRRANIALHSLPLEDTKFRTIAGLRV